MGQRLSMLIATPHDFSCCLSYMYMTPSHICILSSFFIIVFFFFRNRYYVSQIIHSLKYLHKHSVIHRDLKLGNLFINHDMRVKVGDFGLATKLTRPDERKKTICGTPNYIAPEILEGKNGHSFEVDIWSTGVILYTLLVGKPPFEAKDVKSTYKRIVANQYSFPDHTVVSRKPKILFVSHCNRARRSGLL